MAIAINANLSIPPGYLNPGLTNTDQRTIDMQGMNGQSILADMIAKNFTPELFKSAGIVTGIMLAHAGGCTSYDICIAATSPPRVKGQAATKYKLASCRVRIPEIHFSLPVPQKLIDPTNMDRKAIELHPICQAINAGVMQKPISPGDLILVSFSKDLQTLKYHGPVDWTQTQVLKTDFLQAMKCFDQCKLSYPNPGSSGDPIGGNTKGTHKGQLPATNKIPPSNACITQCTPNPKSKGT